jgi:hypothetical protein
MDKKRISKARELWAVAGIVAIEAIIIIMLFLPVADIVTGNIGTPNATVQTVLEIGNVFPEILNITIEDSEFGIDLIPNDTKKVNVVVYARDFNGWEDIESVTAEFYDTAVSFFGDTSRNNYHYTNNSCSIESLGTYDIRANCTFDFWYYAHNSTWEVFVVVKDQFEWNDTGTETTVVNSLIAIGLPNIIDYGTVNATYVSDEQIANVTNFGNRIINLSLSGYAVAPGDGWSMNCTLGTVGNISTHYQKYNLTDTNPGVLNFEDFDNLYRNLTDSPLINRFNLHFRQNDTAPYIDDTNATHWRIFVPLGVAGTCTGNLVFGAVIANE